MLLTYHQINIVKKGIKIGSIQSIDLSHIRKNDYLGFPFPVNSFAEEAEQLEDRWERIIEVECGLFVLSLKHLSKFDKFSLLEDCGIDFRFGIELLVGKHSYNKEGYITCMKDLKPIWKEEGFRFFKPVGNYYVSDTQYRLDYVKAIKDFSEPTDLLDGVAER